VLTPNTILFTWPAFDYSLELGCADQDEITARVQRYLADAIDVEHNLLLTIEKTEFIDRHKKHLLVVFPAFVKLSVEKIFDFDDEDDRSEMRPGAFEICYHHPDLHIHPTEFDTKNYMTWVVARTDFNQSKKGKATAKDTNYTRQALEASRMVARGQNQVQASQQAVPQAQPSSFMQSSYERTHGGTQPAGYYVLFNTTLL
jgi:hypothetical protein